MKALDLSTDDVTAGYLEKGKPTQADRYHNKMSRETEIIKKLRFFSCFLRGWLREDTTGRENSDTRK